MDDKFGVWYLNTEIKRLEEELAGTRRTIKKLIEINEKMQRRLTQTRLMLAKKYSEESKN